MFGPSRRVARRTARRTSRRINRRNDMMDAAAASPEPEQAAPSQQYAPAPPEASVENSYVEELTKLAQLRDAGIISDADFEAKKKQILGI